MSVTRDIVTTWARPRRVFERLLDGPPREDRALAMAMGACLMLFVAQWPLLQRRTVLEGLDFGPLFGGALLGSLFILPLLLYALAAGSGLLLRLAGLSASGHAARLALFWSLLAASPAFLLHGLVGGFIGPGPARNVVGVLALGAFLRFWWVGLRSATR